MEFPMVKLFELVITDHEKDLVFRIDFMSTLKSVVGVTGLSKNDFVVEHLKLRMLLGDRTNHGQPILWREERLLLTKRSKESRTEKNFMKIKFLECSKRNRYMTSVNGIKTASKETDFERVVGHARITRNGLQIYRKE